MIFPKGFLGKLSKRTIDELTKVAADFKFEQEVTVESSTIIGTDFNTVFTPCGPIRGKIIQRVSNGKAIVETHGFSIQEGDLVSSYTRRILDLEKRENELNELKRSIETIKGVLK